MELDRLGVAAGVEILKLPQSGPENRHNDPKLSMRLSGRII